MKKLLIILLAIIVIPLVAALFIPRNYTVINTITINAPSDTVFDYVRFLDNQSRYSEWVLQDPNLKPQISGEDGAVGARQSWDSEVAGSGHQTITAISPGEITMEIIFIRPFAGGATVVYKVGNVGNGSATLSTVFSTSAPWPMNLISYTVGRSMITATQQKNLENVRRLIEGS